MKQLFSYSGVKIVFQIINLFFFLAAQHIFAENEFGLFAYIMSYVPLFQVLISFQVDKYLNANYYKNEVNLLSFLKNNYKYVNILMIIVLTLSPFLISGLEFYFTIILSILLFLTVHVELFLAEKRLEQNHREYLKTILIEIFLFILISFPLLYFKNILYTLLGYLLIKMLIIFQTKIYSRCLYFKFKIEKNDKSLILFCSPLILSAIGLWFYQNYDRSIIKENIGLIEVGVYSYYAKITSIITLVTAGVNSYLSPLFFKYKHLKKEKEVKFIIASLYLVPFFISIFIFIFSPLIFNIEHGTLLSSLVITSFFITVVTASGLEFYNMGNTILISAFNIIVGVFCVIIYNSSIIDYNLISIVYVKLSAAFLYYSLVNIGLLFYGVKTNLKWFIIVLFLFFCLILYNFNI